MFATYSPQNGISLASADTLVHGPATILHSTTTSTPDGYSGTTEIIPAESSANYNGTSLVSGLQNTINSIEEKNAMSNWSSGFTIFGYTMTYETAAIIAVIVIVLILIFR